jgi:hypothetical protein
VTSRRIDVCKHVVKASPISDHSHERRGPMHSVYRHTAISVTLAVALGCGRSPTSPSSSGSLGDSPGHGGGGSVACQTSSLLGEGRASATIDGKRWETCSVFTALRNPLTGFVGWEGQDTGVHPSEEGTQFGFVMPPGVGTYTLSSGMNGGLMELPELKNWIALEHMGGSGTVTVTTFDADRRRVTGTFEFTLDPVAGTGAEGQRRITGGTFEFTYIDPGAVAPGESDTSM